MKRATIESTFKAGRNFDVAGGTIKVAPGVSLTLYALRGRLVINKVTAIVLSETALTAWTDRGESYTFEDDALTAVRIEEAAVKTGVRPGFTPDA